MLARTLRIITCALILLVGLPLLPAAHAQTRHGVDVTTTITAAAVTRAAQQLQPGGASLSNLTVVSGTDQAVTVTGTLDGAMFYLKFPHTWNDQLVLFAHGYVDPGTPATAAAQALVSNADEMLAAPLAEGFAIGYSAFSKIGYAVRSGIDATELLRRLVALLAPISRAYVVGASMGGDVAMALVETHPGQFAGALPLCGVVGGWAEEVRYVIDFRLVYDYFTKPLGAPIALPGAGHALIPNPSLTTLAVGNAVTTLFSLAATKPRYASIIAQIARVTGVNPDVISFATALGAATYGLVDYLQTAGGNGYSNIGKVYLGSADDVALNEGIERIAAVPAAAAYLKRAYTTTGRFSAKVLTVHNLIDPLVPYQQEAILATRVLAQHNSANLVQQIVDSNPSNTSNPLLGGPTHCYFTAKQITFAWHELRDWVERGMRPHNGQNITKK